MQRLRAGLYLLESGRSVNSYLIESGAGLTLVDTGPAARAEALMEEILQAGFNLDDLERIVLTHAHPDHAGGAAALLRRRRVKVYAHPKEAAVLEGKARLVYGSGASGWVRGLPLRMGKRAEPLLDVVAASPREPIRGLPHWQMLHTPGHTPGSLTAVSGSPIASRRTARRPPRPWSNWPP